MLDAEQRSDYREVLKEELASRCRINPRYSLRAFARDLKMAPSRLSEIFSGKQGLSRGAAAEVSSRLGYSPQECEIFCDLVDSLHSRSRSGKEVAREKVEQFYADRETLKLKNETFHLISDWYYLAILELMTTQDFKSDVGWIARRLGISEAEVGLALERLDKFGFIERRSGELRAVEQKSLTPGGVPSDAIKKFHHQMIKKSADAVYLQPMSDRELSSVVIAIDSGRMPMAKKMISDFWREFCTKMELGDSPETIVVKDSVYCLAIQFFGLTERSNHDQG